VRVAASDRPGLFSSLAYPDYRRLWAATLCGQSAAWALLVLRGALVYRLTDSNTWVGLVTMAALLPGLVVTPVAGFLADRFDRRKLLALTFGLNTAHNLLLALLALSGGITEWQLLGLAVLNGSIRAAEMPTGQALLPNLVPPGRLLNAVALNQLMQQGSRMVGPLLVLPVVTLIDPEPAFIVCAALYAVGWSQVLRIGTVSRGVIAPAQGMMVNLVAGVRYIYTHPLLLSVMVFTVLHCALTMAFESIFPFFSRAQLGMETGKELFEGPTYLMIGVGAGSIVGNLALARIEGQRLRGRLFLWLGLLSGLTPIALGFASNIPQAVMAAAAMGAATAAFMTISHTIVQAAAPDALRGRVMSANTWHVQGTMAGFNGLNGVLMDLPWMTAPILLSGTGMLFVALVLGSLLTAQLRLVYARGIPATRGSVAVG